MKAFNIRVYGVLVNEHKQVLVADEFIRGQYYTKFPGGGLELGEGTRSCLEREFMEEMNLRIEVGNHIYTTDFFQLSAFNPDHQIISIYYYVRPLEPITAPIRESPFEFDERELDLYRLSGECETFRYIHLDELEEEKLTLPIDKIVSGLVRQDQLQAGPRRSL